MAFSAPTLPSPACSSHWPRPKAKRARLMHPIRTSPPGHSTEWEKHPGNAQPTQLLVVFVPGFTRYIRDGWFTHHESPRKSVISTALHLFKPCPCPGPELWRALQKHFKICLQCLEELGWQCRLGRKPKAWTGTEMGPESHLFSLPISPVLYSLLLPDPTSIVWTRCSRSSGTPS